MYRESVLKSTNVSRITKIFSYLLLVFAFFIVGIVNNSGGKVEAAVKCNTSSGTSYSTVSDAVSAGCYAGVLTAQQHESFTVASGKEFTLYLNGQSLVSASTSGYAITNNGTLYIFNQY